MNDLFMAPVNHNGVAPVNHNGVAPVNHNGVAPVNHNGVAPVNHNSVPHANHNSDVDVPVTLRNRGYPWQLYNRNVNMYTSY